MGCNSSLYGLPLARDCRQGNALNMVKGIILATEDQVFASKTTAGLKATWLTDIAAKKLYVVSNVENIEDASKESTKQEFESGNEVVTRAAKRGFTAYFNYPLDAHKILRTYQNKFKYYYAFDEAGNILSTSPDGTSIRGISISSLVVGELPVGLASAKPLSKLTLIEKNSSDFDDDGAIIEPYNQGDATDRWYPTELEPVALVTVEQSGVIATNGFTIDVVYKSASTTDAGGDPVTINAIAGMVAANFTVKDGTGAILTPTSVTESTTIPGRYVFVMPATFTAGSVAAKASVTILVESATLTLA